MDNLAGNWQRRAKNEDGLRADDYKLQRKDLDHICSQGVCMCIE